MADMIEVQVLLVAPHMKDLEGATQEVYAIERTPGLVVERLPPDVRRHELVRALHNQRYDVLWFATHGDADGVLLGDDHLLTSDDLIGMVRVAGLAGVVLNSCNSERIAEQLHDETGVDVVCTVTDTPDLSAFQAGALFAQHLGKTGNFRAAFNAAKPGGVEKFRYIPRYRESLVVAPERVIFSAEELRAIFDAINEVRNRLSVVEVDVRYVRQDMDNLRSEVRYMRQGLDGHRDDLKAPVQWGIVIVGLLISIVLFVLLWFVVGRL